MRRVLTTAVAVAGLAFAAAGCGGSDESSQPDTTAAWASDFCTAVGDWKDQLTSITSDLTDVSNLSEDGLRSAGEDARSATDQLVDDLRGLGAPDTPSGQDVRDALDTLSTTLDEETASIDETVQGITSLADLPSAISEISSSVGALSTAFSNALQAIDDADVNGELQTALEDAPECQGITS